MRSIDQWDGHLPTPSPYKASDPRSLNGHTTGHFTGSQVLAKPRCLVTSGKSCSRQLVCRDSFFSPKTLHYHFPAPCIPAPIADEPLQKSENRLLVRVLQQLLRRPYWSLSADSDTPSHRTWQGALRGPYRYHASRTISNPSDAKAHVLAFPCTWCLGTAAVRRQGATYAMQNV
jgi:hypothetical protein